MLFSLPTFLSKKDRLSGFHQGNVVDNEDPDLLGHVTVRVPGIIEGPDDCLPWFAPKFHNLFGGNATSQQFSVPKVGATVLVQFDRNIAYNGYYLGHTLSSELLNTVFATDYPNTYGSIDTSDEGLIIELLVNRLSEMVSLKKTNSDGTITSITIDEAANASLVVDGNLTSHTGNDLTVTADNAISITANGSTVNIESKGQEMTIKTGDGNLTIDAGSGNIIIKGDNIDINSGTRVNLT